MDIHFKHYYLNPKFKSFNFWISQWKMNPNLTPVHPNYTWTRIIYHSLSCSFLQFASLPQNFFDKIRTCVLNEAKVGIYNYLFNFNLWKKRVLKFEGRRTKVEKEIHRAPACHGNYFPPQFFITWFKQHLNSLGNYFISFSQFISNDLFVQI